MKWDFTFRHDRIHFWGTNFLTVYIDFVICHFGLCWPASRWIIKLWTIGQLPDESSNYGSLQSFSFCCVKFYLSLCYHFTFTWTVAITGVYQIEYFSLYSCLLLAFWIYVPLLLVWELVEDSGDLRQPQNLTYEETCGSLNFKTVAHLNYSLYFIQNLTGPSFPKLYLNLQYLSNRGFTFFLLLAVWLLCEGLQHFWECIVVLLVALSAVLTVVKIYIIIAISVTIHYRNCDCYSNKDKLILSGAPADQTQKQNHIFALLLFPNITWCNELLWEKLMIKFFLTV